eukprot:PITA_29945
MDGFSGYNQIKIAPDDQEKTTFICPWGTFAYKKLSFGLKNVGATFQQAMSYVFHDICSIVQPYLDDLPAHSSTLSIKCEIPSLKLSIEILPETSPQEECLLSLERLYETRHLAALVIKAQKKLVKSHFDQLVSPRAFFEGDLVLLYDQANDKLGAGKFEPMWRGLYIVKCVLHKEAYELIDYEGNPLDKPRNGLYLKKYYA